MYASNSPVHIAAWAHIAEASDLTYEIDAANSEVTLSFGEGLGLELTLGRGTLARWIDTLHEARTRLEVIEAALHADPDLHPDDVRPTPLAAAGQVPA